MHRWLLLVLAALALLPRVALAQGPSTNSDAAIAESLFQEAKVLLDAGDVPAACRKLEESCRLEPLPGALLNLAVCHEQEGKTATAWTEFHEALALARSDGREDRKALAEERIAALLPRLAKVTVRMPKQRAPGLALLIAGRSVGEVVWGTAVPVNPGELAIRAEAIEHEPFEQTVRVTEGQNLELDIPALKPIVRKPPRVDFITLREPPPPAPEPQPDPAWQIAGYSAIGVGGAAAVAGVITGVYALVEDAAADKRCGETTCPDLASQGRSDNANQAAVAANVLLPIGLTLVAGGVTVVLVTTFASDEPKRAALTVGGSFW